MANTLQDQLSGVEKQLEEAPIPIQYILYYRKTSSPHPEFLTFFMKTTNMRKVMERARRHCEVMNYRFVQVTPFVVDLDKAENFMINKET